VSLIANALESEGLPTLVVGTVRDIMEQAPAPRSVFVDFPVGRTFGHPADSAEQQLVLRGALGELPNFTQHGQIIDLPFTWAGDDRSWERMIQQELAPRT